METCLLRIRGLVQGVGFRPHVWHLANALGLDGWVRNDGGGVTIALRGARVAEFIARLPEDLPVLARIDACERLPGERLLSEAVLTGAGFHILASESGAVDTAIGPDAAICPACAAEICDPASRRWRYAFSTCTHCGPRYTVSSGIPYDRARTSLAAFALCPACDGEYRDPADRRFHAETTCCPACGPQLQYLAGDGAVQAGDALALALADLQAGRIVAIKGLGGFHLACDADHPQAVAELRRRKGREAKPFAVMVLNAASAADIAHVGPAEAQLLAATAAPIVLCAKGAVDLPGIAPGLAELGLMLPATPLHLLLWHEAAGRPGGTAWLAQPHALRLVMTSANPGGEPLVIGNDEAVQRQAGLADAYLLHDRDIVVRCDDSLLRAGDDGPQFLRRARGYVPVPVALRGQPNQAPILALGGYLKNTLCVLRGDEAFLSQHIGSQDNAATLAFQEECVAHLLAVLAVRPAVIAHDAHPDYPSIHLAQRLAATWGVPALPVPHHAAHLAAIAAEHRLEGPLIGLALDGVGLGPDGELWGGELLRLDGARCTRLGRLRPLALPGGDRAAREPWRMAISAFHALGRSEAEMVDFLAHRHPGQGLGPLPQMLARGLNSPLTSSLGRVFDAAAGLLGIRSVAAYEGQAAMELEALARRQGAVLPLAAGYRLGWVEGVAELDLLPLLAALPDYADVAQGAACFHATLAQALLAWLDFALAGASCVQLALGGGCAQNALLLTTLREALAARGVRLLTAGQVPTNDGGLALGQAWWARQCAASLRGAE